MITSSYTSVDPNAMMIKPIDAHIADITMPTSRKSYYSANWADLFGPKLLQQTHERDVVVFGFYITRTHQLHDDAEKEPEAYGREDYGLGDVECLVDHVWKD